MESSKRQLRAMLRKNWLLKIRHPFTTLTEILLPTIVMLMLIAIRTRVDTTIHPVQSYIKKGMFVEVGKSEISPSFETILELLVSEDEYLAFAPDTSETRFMLDALAIKFPLIKMVGRIYMTELDLEDYIRSDLYGITDPSKNLSNPIIKGAIVFHEQGPKLFDYSIRLNHTWAFSGFPDIKTIMDVNGPYLNDLELGMNIVPTLQYGFSGFLTLQQVMDSLVITLAQKFGNNISSDINWGKYIPENINIAPFPTREYTDDEFQTIVKRVMGVIYLLGFLYPVSRLISYSVFEKEQKIKEGLYMMGLKDEIFYLSWFMTYFVQFAISSAIITCCTMTTLFLYSDKSLVFIYFFVFSISSIMLSFLISAFFSRSKTAAAVGTLSFLAAFFPYYSVIDPSVLMIWKVLASLLSPTAFALGTVNFADYERAHVGLRWTNMFQSSSGVNFLVCLVMMIADIFLYCFIGLYLDKVLPREYGVRYPWNFLFTRSFWQRKKTVESYGDNSEFEIQDQFSKFKTECSDKSYQEPDIESVSLDMKQQELDGRCVKIKNLHKVYMTKKGNCCAVNSLNLTLFENQIFALLGHNGAGKSTTISMLVGLIPPTSGDALIFGKSIRTHMDEVRKTLGVCPQNDILFSELTVKEHMEIFAILKGVQEECLDREVTDMIDQVGLADKASTVVGSLSGGMKRKLSLGIALIGNNKVIILDEPTSGMDPYSMRSTWQLINKIKKGRVILLTTHSMDEADVLGDRIAILANGHLRCIGSSLFLKHKYGVGYKLTIVKNSSAPSDAAEIIHRHIPTATCISDVGTEISFRLPLSSSHSFEPMFREIESCIQKSAQQSNNTLIPINNNNCIESYGISVTTLEEVFLRVSEEHQTQTEQISSPPSSSDSVHLFNIKSIRCIYSTLLNVSLIVLNFIFSAFSKLCCCKFLARSNFWKHSKALFIKRAVSARRDRRTVVFQLIIPAVFLLLGLIFLKLKPHPDPDEITLTTSYFNPLYGGWAGGGGPVPFNLSLPIALKVASNVKGGWIQKQEPRSFRFPNSVEVLEDAINAAGPTLGPNLISMSEFLITSLNESYESRYGAVVMNEVDESGTIGYTVLHNSSCQHAGPTYINIVNSALLRLATRDVNMTIQIRNHPLPMTMSQRSQRHDLDAFSASIIVGIAFSFIPASFAVAIVKEREVKAKHQQLISGVSILSYWVSTYIWDFISFLFPTFLAMILFFIFGLSQFIGNGCLVPTLLIFLNYGLAVASSTYCLTFFFSDHSVAQNVVLLIHFFSGLILMVISFIMGLVEATKGANSILKNFFRIAPGFCFSDGLASLALRQQDTKLGHERDAVLDWNVTGASICYLAAEGILYFLLTIILELFPFQKPKFTLLQQYWRNLTSSRHSKSEGYTQPLLRSGTDASIEIETGEDEDVKAERQKILDGRVNNAMIYLYNLRKVYGSEVAVNSLTFSVNEGECFGFLGTNGAGKTTTLSMLTGEEIPSDGTAYILGNDIRSNPKAARRHIGYCPQFDALLEFLTVREHLELYARIKGVPESSMNHVVNEKLLEFDLLNSVDKPSYALSGGNKRKLSVATAMIGNPPIVILDEPSTGMDPIAKRFMWDVISRISSRRGKTAIILTTHSMNEAQALCTQIAIMVGGRLRCIGSSQHLKSRFGNYLELEVKPSEIKSSEIDSLCRTIQSTLYDSLNHPKRIINDIESCIGASGKSYFDNISEIRLTKEMIVFISKFLGNEEFIEPIGEQLVDQLIRDGGISLRIFAEWWLAKEKFSQIDSFMLDSFPGATSHGFNGSSVKYQLPYGEDVSLADIFGHIEHNRLRLGFKEYSISQSTLETIFNHFAADQH